MISGSASPPRAPDLRWWLLLGAVVALGFVGSWAVASAVLILVLAQVARPFDFLTAFLILVGGATFIENAAGGLTTQLGLLTCGIVLMLVCYVLTSGDRTLRFARTPMTVPLLCFLALSMVNAVRGLLVGHSPRYVSLESLPLLALGTAILVANAFHPMRQLRWAAIGLVVIGLAAAIRGFQVFAISRTHGGGYTVAAPGLVGLLLVNLALRSRSTGATVGLILLSVPMFLQQFITFGRGLWSGCIAALVLSVLIYAGFGRGSGGRWRRTGLILAGLTGLALAGVLVMARVFEQGDLLGLAGVRLQSSLGTEVSYETRSNVIRLGEYFFVWKLIQESPWIGHGIGYAFTMKQVLSLDVGEQWYAHQNYLFVWLKQGLIGLGLFLWMLYSAISLGMREARRRADPLEASWFATSAAATVFLATLSLSNFPFGVVNEMFLLALLWGGAMAMTRTGFVLFRWSVPTAREHDGA